MSYQILEIQGTKYFVPEKLKDDFIYCFMLEHNRIYEADLISFLMSYINSDSVVIDVGGQIGNHSIQFAKKAKKVFAFEPIKQNYNLFEKNILLNNVGNVELFKMAVADEECKLRVNELNFKPLTSSGGIHLFKSKSGYISAVTIDEILLPILEDKVSIIKFDVEEMELQAIKGALKIIKRFLPIIYTEIKRARLGSKQKLEDIRKILVPLGYNNYYFKAFMGDIWITADDKRWDKNKFQPEIKVINLR